MLTGLSFRAITASHLQGPPKMFLGISRPGVVEPEVVSLVVNITRVTANLEKDASLNTAVPTVTSSGISFCPVAN